MSSTLLFLAIIVADAKKDVKMQRKMADVKKCKLLYTQLSKKGMVAKHGLKGVPLLVVPMKL